MNRPLLLLLLSLWLFGLPLISADLESRPRSWVIWMDGTRYVPDWSYALSAVLRSMQTGDTALLVLPGEEIRLVKNREDDQLEDLVARIRPGFEAGAQGIRQLADEMVFFSNEIAARGELNSIKGFLYCRKQLLDLYAASQRRFWQYLGDGRLEPGCRLLVLVQQFDVPAVDRDSLRHLMEGRLRDWVLELQTVSPWGESRGRIESIAAGLKRQKNRVDVLYIKDRSSEGEGASSAFRSSMVRRGSEVSKTLYRAVALLSRICGGVSRDLRRSGKGILEDLGG